MSAKDRREPTTRDFEGFSNVHIKCADGLPASTSVTVDGVPIIGIVEARWEISVDQLSRAYLVLEGVSVDVLAEYVNTKVYGLKNPPKEIK